MTLLLSQTWMQTFILSHLFCFATLLMVQIPVHLLVQNLKMTNFPKGGNVHAGKNVCCGTFNMLVAGLTL